MGVEFISCTYCDEIFPDCGGFFSCESCGKRYCSVTCAGRNYDEDTPSDCRICAKQYVEDWVLLEFLLKEFKLTRDDAEELYFKDIEREPVAK